MTFPQEEAEEQNKHTLGRSTELETGRLGPLPWVTVVPETFLLGAFLLGFAVLLELPNYVRGGEKLPLAAAVIPITLTDACFLYIWWRGGWVARLFALPWGLFALFNTYTLIRWAMISFHR